MQMDCLLLLRGLFLTQKVQLLMLYMEYFAAPLHPVMPLMQMATE